jgi:hypothetical protein
VAPGEPGFITRLDIRIEATDISAPSTQSFSLTEAEQQQATVELLVPLGSNRRIIVSALNASETEIFHGETLVDLTQDVTTVTLTLVRILVLEAANPATLANGSFTFADGTVFGVTGVVTLTFGSFTGNTSVFTLISGSQIASGSITIATVTTSTAQSRAVAAGQSRQTTPTRCDFVVATSTYQPGQGPQTGDHLPITPCATDAVDGRLTLGESTSAPPVPAPALLAPNTVSIGSPPGSVTPGGAFTVPVMFNTGTTPVISYLFELTFDPAVVHVVDIAGLAPFDNLLTHQAAFSSGTVRFAANNTTFTPTSGLLTFASIAFQVVGNAGTSSPLTLRFPSTPGGTGVIVDNVFRPLAGVIFVNGAVEVR